MIKYDIPQFMLYARDPDDDSYTSLFVTVIDLEYEYVSGCDIRDITAEQRCKSNKREVTMQTLYMLLDVCQEHMCGSFDEEDHSFDDRKAYQKKWKQEEKAKPCISSDKVWQALRCELSADEMSGLFNLDNRYEKADYFDLDCCLDKVRRYERGELSDSYFKDWCLILMRCVGQYMSNTTGKRAQIYADISDMLDGLAFSIGSSYLMSKEEVVGELTARFKWYNHLLENVNNRSSDEFEKNGVVVYKTFGFCSSGGKDCIDFLCIVDKANKRINFKLVKNYILNKDIDYSFVGQVEFDDLSNEYYEYEFDETLDETAQYKQVG